MDGIERAIVLDTDNPYFAGMEMGPAFHFGAQLYYPYDGRYDPLQRGIVHGMKYTPFEGWQYELHCVVGWLSEDVLYQELP